MGVGGTAKYTQLLATATPPLLLTGILFTLQHTSPEVAPRITQHLFRREDEAQCPVNLASPNACSLVRELCPDFDGDGLIPYLRLYACSPASAQPLVLIAMAVWLVVLFASMATAASEFLAVHLQFIVQTVGISENLAGVTIFAFGNGCTDLFSTLAAMGANSGSLAISELFGAAAFITTVVLGLIVIIKPFQVDPRSFVGDLIWFMIAASLLVAFLADGQLVLAECLGIIALYVGFVFFAILRPKSPEPSVAPPIDNEIIRHHVDNDDDQASDLLVMEPGETAHSSRSETSDLEQITQADTESTPSLGLESPYIHELVDPDTSHTPLLEAREMEDYGLLPEATTAPIETELPGALSQQKWTESFPPIRTWHDQSTGEKLLTVFCLPLLFPIGLTTPPLRLHVSQDEPGHRVVEPDSPVTDGTFSTLQTSWSRILAKMRESWTRYKTPSFTALASNWMLTLQLILGPQLFISVAVSQTMTSSTGSALLLGSVTALITSVLLITYTFSSSPPGGGLGVSIFAFITALTWIFLTATSAVTLLMALAFILRIPTALLGATIFAVGQSSNDLVANTAVAKRGMPVLAASATFGGPMMNMLMGIGGGGLVQVLKSQAAGGRGVYTFQTAAGLFVSAACLLLGLGVTLVWTFRNSWRLDKGLGVTLIGLWVVFTAGNVLLSFTTE